MRLRARGFLLVWVIALLGAACGSAGVEADNGISSHDPALVQTGSEAYGVYCAACHGPDLMGTNQGPSFLSAVYEPGHHADIAFLLAAQRGVSSHHWRFGDMPAVEGVTSEDIEAIVAFVRETQRVEGFEPYPP
ncbi:MAG: cytochrome c [Acidimicrobiia bacterium]|nr:cytochrome c [Acidimicrobiia bacterium]NNL98058.1 cytochrome c [Acidimicrobiia bacterium]